MYEEIVQAIVDKNREIAHFWSNPEGWAPTEASDLLSQSHLDLQVSLSETLFLWLEPNEHPGRIRLAWVNIGALREGSLKWFLAVYFRDYLTTSGLKGRSGKLIPPDELRLQKLKLFFANRIQYVYDDFRPFIELAQYRRNGIHSFKHRDIGTQKEVIEGIINYRDFLFALDTSVPYP